MADELADKEYVLGDVQQSREDLALALAEQARQARAHQVALQAAKRRVAELEGDTRAKETTITALRGELKSEQEAREGLRVELEKAQKGLRSAATSVHDLQVCTGTATSLAIAPVQAHLR